jgi:hypothetical protein
MRFRECAFGTSGQRPVIGPKASSLLITCTTLDDCLDAAHFVAADVDAQRRPTF